MKFDFSIRVAGEAGQGIQTVGSLLCSLVNNCGYEFFAHQDYMSRVRGGNNYYQVRISSERKAACRERIHVLAALNAESVPIHRTVLEENGQILLDQDYFKVSDHYPSFVNIPFHEIATRLGGDAYYVNSVVFGALAGMFAFDVDIVENVAQKEFAAKGKEIAKKNLDCVRSGYELGRHHSFVILPKSIPFSRPRFMINGNEAIALGAVYGGCRFYSGYPMTPSTTVMETMATLSSDGPVVVEQAEDEIAAINMVIGASYAGVRAMTGTSGGGFCLMTEGLSLAAMLETPVVIVLGQRPAPATGLPTRTEQADLNLAIFAGHGEFARVVFSPGSLEEAFKLTVRAFDLSDRFQVPSIILTDQYLADIVKTVDDFNTDLPRQRHAVSRKEPARYETYKRYTDTPSGVSPRAVPSWIADVIYADSDEHTEEGHITEDPETRTMMVNKRFLKKMTALRREAIAPVAVHLDHARFLLLGFGSTQGVIEEICESPDFQDFGGMHFPQVWPFPGKALNSHLKKLPLAYLITVENNAGAQLAYLIERETKAHISHSILKYDGRPFTVEELGQQLKNFRNNYERANIQHL
jgi:2-oxoglutarate/2-oxoacid ferredoxin oxidoreductase subunit alpha